MITDPRYRKLVFEGLYNWFKQRGYEKNIHRGTLYEGSYIKKYNNYTDIFTVNTGVRKFPKPYCIVTIAGFRILHAYEDLFKEFRLDWNGPAGTFCYTRSKKDKEEGKGIFEDNFDDVVERTINYIITRVESEFTGVMNKYSYIKEMDALQNSKIHLPLPDGLWTGDHDEITLSPLDYMQRKLTLAWAAQNPHYETLYQNILTFWKEYIANPADPLNIPDVEMAQKQYQNIQLLYKKLKSLPPYEDVELV